MNHIQVNAMLIFSRTLNAAPILFVLFLLLVTGVAPDRNQLEEPDRQQREDKQILQAVESVREKVAPDRRIAVFDINWERQSGQILIRGEVDNPATREKVIEAIREAGFNNLDDRIQVLPHPELDPHTHGVVRVSVAQMRSEPQFSSELVTQVLLGTPLRVLKRHRGWFYVQTPDQYLGWMSSGHFERMDPHTFEHWEASDKVIVTAHHGTIHEVPDAHAVPVGNVVIGNLLVQTGTSDDWIAVSLPDGRSGFISNDLVENYGLWKESRELTGENITETAKMFIGVPYLWGGTSAIGFDCSGLTKTVFWLNGMDLSRDASQQIRMGEHADPGQEFEHLQKGDLLFFGRAATVDSPERIVHVGIYLGNLEFIHASNLVRINSLDPEASNFDWFEYNRFIRARRLIP